MAVMHESIKLCVLDAFLENKSCYEIKSNSYLFFSIFRYSTSRWMLEAELTSKKKLSRKFFQKSPSQRSMNLKRARSLSCTRQNSTFSYFPIAAVCALDKLLPFPPCPGPSSGVGSHTTDTRTRPERMKEITNFTERIERIRKSTQTIDGQRLTPPPTLTRLRRAGQNETRNNV